MTKKLDKKKIDTLEKGLRNLSEHDNLAPRLRKMENQINFLGSISSLYLIFFIVILAYLMILGGLLP